MLRILTVAVALLASGAVYQRVGARRQKRRFAPPGVLIDVGGHRLHVRCIGEGSPVVVLESGIAASSLSWAAVQPLIAAFARVCAYDRAGLAWSDAPSSARTFDRIVGDLEAVLERVAPGERYVLVGHSFGSFVVRAYASRHPERVAGMVLVDPAIEWLTASPERERMLWGGRHLSRVGAVLAHLGVVRACLALLTGGTPSAPRTFVKIFGPTAAATLERLVLEVRKLPADVHPVVQALWCQPKCFHAMADHLRALERDTAVIAAVRTPRDCPLVVISGGDQPPGQIAAHQRLAATSADGRHIVARHSAHWIQFDEPGLIVEAVRALVASQRSRPDGAGPSGSGAERETPVHGS